MKQAEDTKTRDMLEQEPITRQIERLLQERLAIAKKLQAQIDDLEKLGTVLASPNYKAGKYLYLIHPTAQDGSRKREYVGADPGKIREAMEAINRYNEVQDLKRELGSNEHRIRRAEQDLKAIMGILKW